MIAFLQRKRRNLGRVRRQGVSLQVEILGGRVTPSTFVLDGPLASREFGPIHPKDSLDQPSVVGTRRSGEEVPALGFVPILAQAPLNQLVGAVGYGEELTA